MPCQYEVVCRCLLLASLVTVEARVEADEPARAEAPSMAFYYGAAPPVELLGRFDRVVIEADHLDAAGLRALHHGGTAVFAYVSAGELNPSRALARRLEPGWILGRNAAFGSAILDQTQAGWRELLLEGWVRPLWNAGYRGFFLDALDSYRIAISDDAGRTAQAHALAATLDELRRRFPGAQVILNRGFELAPMLAQPPDGVVAESLFHGRAIGPEGHSDGNSDGAVQGASEASYVEVAKSDRDWLVARLREIEARWRVPITIVDYVSTRDRQLMRETARRIAALGFTPFVSDAGLDVLGVGAIEIVPRRILAVWSSREQADGEARDLADTDLHRYGTMPLEYLGYAVDYVDADGPLPEFHLAGRYAGVVTWFTQDLRRPTPYRDFLTRTLEDGVRVAILGNLGFDPSGRLRELLGAHLPEVHLRGSIRIGSADSVVGFEAPPAQRIADVNPLSADGEGVHRHLVLEDAQHHRADAVFTGNFGGIALDPFVVEPGARGSQRWILDPFVFYQLALRLGDDPIPAADVTTEEGRRLLIVHVDGDGFVSRAERVHDDFAGKVILDEILRRYTVPTTVSVIEGEVGPLGRYPELAPSLEAIARDIFRLPHVEVATHTYSHPFDWQRLGERQSDGDVNGLLACKDMRPPIVGCDDAAGPKPARHAVSREAVAAIIERDVAGSVDYINRRLAPPGKPVKMVLWSGNALPPEAAIARARSLGLANMNGGDTAASRLRPSLTNVSPIGRPVGAEYQVYAPVTNENIYTNLWRGPFYGFRDVISTFEITGSPRRIKPINIYYHFYSGTKIGALAALKSVYDWALAQQPEPVFASEYAARAVDFQHLTLARGLDGGWRLRGDGRLRSLRLPLALGAPDLARSRGVTGVWDLPEGRYLGLRGTGHEVIYFANSSEANRAP